MEIGQRTYKLLAEFSIHEVLGFHGRGGVRDLRKLCVTRVHWKLSSPSEFTDDWTTPPSAWFHFHQSGLFWLTSRARTVFP